MTYEFIMANNTKSIILKCFVMICHVYLGRPFKQINTNLRYWIMIQCDADRGQIIHRVSKIYYVAFFKYLSSEVQDLLTYKHVKTEQYSHLMASIII